MRTRHLLRFHDGETSIISRETPSDKIGRKRKCKIGEELPVTNHFIAPSQFNDISTSTRVLVDKDDWFDPGTTTTAVVVNNWLRFTLQIFYVLSSYKAHISSCSNKTVQLVYHESLINVRSCPTKTWVGWTLCQTNFLKLYSTLLLIMHTLHIVSTLLNQEAPNTNYCTDQLLIKHPCFIQWF